MTRRRFLLACGGVLLSETARAQASKTVVLLLPFAPGHTSAQATVATLRETLAALGWKDGGNLRLVPTWAGSDPEEMRRAAAETVLAVPDALFVHGAPMLESVRPLNRAIPVVFVQVPDPVRSGVVRDLARPDGHVTGFTNSTFEIGAKWLEVLRDLHPRIARVLILQDEGNPSWRLHVRSIQAFAASLDIVVEASTFSLETDMEPAISAFASKPGGACIALPSPVLSMRRDWLVEVVARHRLPTIYPFNTFVRSGGLASYGIDTNDLYRRAAFYLDRLLRGDIVRNLPIQQPTKFELALNLRAARALGLSVSDALLLQADEVIE